MKNKILSYVLGLFIFICFAFGYVHAGCGCEYYQYDKEAYNQCVANCDQQQQQQQRGEKCGESDLPSGMYCCDGIPVNIPCDSVVVTGCNGIKLNTDFPLIGNCIHLKKGEGGVDSTTVLPVMIGSLMKITMSVVMVVCFIMIIIAGIKRSSNSSKEAQDLIKKVAITVLLLGLSGVILKVINPLFFS